LAGSAPDDRRPPARPHVVLGVSGGIAAYKACELLRRFTESGHDVTVVPTAAALEFVGAATWSALSGKPVASDLWHDVHRVPHVRIGQTADLVVVAPATADLLAKAVHGLAGRHVVVSAGGTREYLDPVRFLGNRSSGRQGYALARTAAARGAEVTLLSANVSLPDPAGVKVVRVETTAQLRDAVLAAAPAADAVVMAAAPADYRPRTVSSTKIKKAEDGTAPPLELEQNPDILAEISHSRARPGTVIVGFAAETGDSERSVLELAKAKLARKGCDLLVLNDVSGGKVFGSAENEAVVLDATGRVTPVPRGSKAALAHVIWDQVVARLDGDASSD
jgi:phosphopantothenoylcysteine synthetase/decarboxylase